jgi:hypothetical protein
MRVEIRHPDNGWRILRNASAVHHGVNVYEVTVTGVPLHVIGLDIFDRATLRIDGHVSVQVLGIHRHDEVVTLMVNC